LPSIDQHNTHTWHVFCIRVLNNKREKLIEHLKKNSIGFNIHYPLPPHLQNCYKDLDFKLGDYPIAESTSKEILSLPLSPFHKIEEIIQTIISIKGFLKK